jgi:thiosulfate/3-mercaptopyruvate sulfurtransferase
MTVYTHRIGAQALAGLPQGQTVLFDCRHDLMRPDWGAAQFAHAHLPFARFAALDTALSGVKTGRNGRHPLPQRDVFSQWLLLQGANDTVQIVCYDQLDGMYAARLWWMCRWAGFANVAVLEGGYAAWRAMGGAVTSAASSGGALSGAATTAFTTIASSTTVSPPQRAALEHVWTSDDVLRNLSSAAPIATVVDARAPERYRGEVEPMDAVAGHIPLAINHVFKRNVDAQGLFVDDLTQRWQATMALAADLPLVHQCGSGVTACHNILALHVAGIVPAEQASQLYAGSWSEWCSEPSRPVAKA